MFYWGDEGMAPSKEARIAAHRAPKIRFRDRLKVAAFAVRMGAWACWQYNRRLFWTLVLAFAGLACIAASIISLVLGVIF